MPFSSVDVKDVTYEHLEVSVITQDLMKADLQVKALIQDIRKCSGPLEILNSLNSQVSENMRKIKLSLEDLETVAREQDRDAEKQDLLKEVVKYQKQYAANQFNLRKANLACQTLLEKQSRDELFEAEPLRKRNTRADKDILSKQSAAITDRLATLAGSLASQVAQSDESLRTLASSSATVHDTQDEFRTMGGILIQTRTLLQKYGHREVTDRVLVAIAAIFFLVCVLYITHKRLF